MLDKRRNRGRPAILLLMTSILERIRPHRAPRLESLTAPGPCRSVHAGEATLRELAVSNTTVSLDVEQRRQLSRLAQRQVASASSAVEGRQAATT